MVAALREREKEREMGGDIESLYVEHQRSNEHKQSLLNFVSQGLYVLNRCRL